MGCGHKGQKAPYFPCLRSLCSDNKEVFSSTQLPQLVKGTLSSLKMMQRVPLMAFSLCPLPQLQPQPSAPPIWQICFANLSSYEESLGKISVPICTLIREMSEHATQPLGICLSPALSMLFASRLPLPQAIFLEVNTNFTRGTLNQGCIIPCTRI